MKAHYHQAPFLLAGVDFEGESREMWCLNLEQARSVAGQCMAPGDGPPWQGWEIWGNHPVTANWECLETSGRMPDNTAGRMPAPTPKPYAARYLCRRAADRGEFPCWKILTSALASPASALEMIADWNRRDAGRFVWRFETCLPDDFDYPLLKINC